jgi:hypothetical protein
MPLAVARHFLPKFKPNDTESPWTPRECHGGAKAHILSELRENIRI